MKRILAVLVACSAVAAWGQTMTMQEARKRIPELAGLSDQSALNVIHEVYYPGMDKAELASRLGVILPAPKPRPRFEVLEGADPSQFEGVKFYGEKPVPPKRTLGPIDKWRYESCQTDAAKAPTSQGVFAGMRVCREKFGQ